MPTGPIPALHRQLLRPTPGLQLATEFRLRSTEVVDRIQALEAQGQLTGVMDERGKFIFISEEEMKAVAEFIRGRGRIAIAELAARSGVWAGVGWVRGWGGVYGARRGACSCRCNGMGWGRAAERNACSCRPRWMMVACT